MSAFELWFANFVIRPRKSNVPRALCLGCAFLSLALSSAWAVDPNHRISQYAHTAWRTQDGTFNGSPIVITQTTDGYLWIGTNIGLVRFDGVRFTSWNPPTGQRLLDSRILSLLGTHDGTLWIGTGYSISRWKDGELTNYPQLSGRIESLVEDGDGALWLARTQPTDKTGPLCRIKDEQFRCYGASDGIPFDLAIQLSKGSSGELWVGGYSELCRWRPGSCASYFANPSRSPETFASLRGLATGPDGSVWADIDRSSKVLRLEQFKNGSWNGRDFPELPADNSDVTTLFVDRDGVVWIGTGSHGVFRIRGEEVDHFGKADGLSSDAVGRFFQDAEGTLWIATSEGIDNFRDLKVVTYSMREGLSAAGASSVLAARDGTVWIGNFRALNSLRDGKLSAIRAEHGLPGLNVTTIFDDHADRLWVGVDSGMWVYDHNVFREVRHADGSALGIVFSITEDVQHNVWVRAGTHLDRIHGLRVDAEFSSPQISNAYILASNPRGGIFLGLVNGDLVQFQDGKTQTILSNEVGSRRQIRDLLVEPDGSAWGTTLDEVSRWKDGKRQNLTTHNGLPCDGIFALVQDKQSSLWLYSQCGLITIETSELDSWWAHPDRIVNFKLLDAFDGVQPGLTSLKPQARRSPDGRLWFVNGRVLQVVDPAHLHDNTIAPPVQVEEIVADRKLYAPRKDLRLPALTRDLEIQYTGLSFEAPEKVRFRYKLEGRDANWQEPGTRRQAFYSDLPPGNYRFRVIACNNDGVWNEAGATLNFSIAPAWYQTNWFRVLCVVGAAFIGWALYRLRVRQIAKALSARFDERLAERTRIARDLHDTFLQTIQGSKLVADDALDASADPDRMRRAMEQLSGWLAQAMQEGRAALNSLRTSTTQRNDLAEAFRRATENGHVPSSMEATLSVVGEVTEMHPIVRDEVYRIGYEAIRNAYLHSQATRLEVELCYEQDLTLRVRDNGVGIDPAVVSTGKEGHFGLRGMRERAARIGAHLTIQSSATSGTEMAVVVPGRVVFRKARKTRSGKRDESL